MAKTTKTTTKKVKTAKPPKAEAGSLEAQVFNVEGKAVGTVSLPENVFGLKWNADLVHQVVTSMLSSRRAGTAHTKNRGEVSGTGKKPWQQKGTGRARHGSRRSPIWRTGGVAHGPRTDKSYDRKVNTQARRKALYTVLSAKLRDGEVLFLDSVSMRAPKTKEAKEVFEKLGHIKGYEGLPTKRNNSMVLAMPKKDQIVEKSFRNFGNVSVVESRNLNPVDILNYKYLVIANPESYISSVTKQQNN